MSEQLSEKRPRDIFVERGYLIEPWPEEWCRLDNVGSDHQVLGCRFTIGVKILSETPSGLKLIPTAQIVFEIDGKQMDLLPSVGRDIAKRIEEMCDAADKINQSQRKN